jgi:Family of unknown function (DUF5989)
MQLLDNFASRIGILGELFTFFSTNKRWWLTPLIVILALFGLLIAFAQTSAVAPFIYTLF